MNKKQSLGVILALFTGFALLAATGEQNGHRIRCLVSGIR
jgi:hypothetical protein